MLLDSDNDKKNLLCLKPDQELSDVEKRYSLSALRIFKERYLLKSLIGMDEEGEPIYETVERLDDLFKRVAVAAGIMEVLYDEQFYDKDQIDLEGVNNGFILYLSHLEDELQTLEQQNIEIDYRDIHKNNIPLPYGFSINPFHKERLMSRYLELAYEGKISVKFEEILEKLQKEGTFKLKYISLIQKYYHLMANKIFLPNTPCLMNAGTKLNQNAACFTLAMEDSLDGIYQTYADIAKVFKSGGGIGINYSNLRPEGAFVKSTGGRSSGTISWLKGTDETTGRVSQGGKRRGASMAILDYTHKDIDKFIHLKDNNTLVNHNISVCTDDRFFQNFLDGSPRETDLMNKICRNAHKTADPGMVFLENMNSNNLLEPVFQRPIKVTNPCSEISMYEYDSCILASINLTKFVKDGRFDLEEFISVSATVTKFLDAILDATDYPIEKINKMTKDCRRIGVGYMGLGDVLTQLGIPYNSIEGFIFCEYITAIMTMATLLESNRQAGLKGSFPLYYHDNYPKTKIPVNGWNNGSAEALEEHVEPLNKYFSYRFTESRELYDILATMNDLIDYNKGFRNCSTTTIAPTGTLSMFVDCSSGIEPVFSHAYTKKVTIGDFIYVNEHLNNTLGGLYTPELLQKIINNNGSLQSLEEIPADIRRVFVTAMDIHPFDHLMMQASAQHWITNGISKTINAPNDISPKMIEYIYTLAWAFGCKGTTVYRDGCKSEQVLNNASIEKNSSNLKASSHTTEYIADIELPFEYKQQLLKACNNGAMVYKLPPQTTGTIVEFTYPSGTITERSTVISSHNVVMCTNCLSFNTLERNGACQICRHCGTMVGSCS